ncbi:MAG: gliding motility-associated C-terminal domain-containing protein, partial [Bacteroidota bacterium]|nr:gliding motility-associated C-terminal domain-containing protein [Bacteroidota bacterium]
CSATSSQIINTVRALPNPTLTSSDADNIFCEGSTVTFTAGGGSNYNFRVDGTSVQNSTSTTYVTSSLTDGQVVDVIVTNSNGCTAASSQIINSVDARPDANAGTGGNECDLTFQLNAVPSVGIGTWTRTAGPSGATATFSPSSNSPTAIATVSAYGTYTFTWTETNGTCSASSSVTVNFYRQPVASAGTGGNNCGLSYILNGSLDVGSGTWTRVSGPGTATFTPNANTPGATVTVTQYGSYTFRWTVVNGTCTTAPTVNVNFYSQPPADAGEGGTECDLDFQLNAVPGASTGSWSKVSGPGNVAFSPGANLYNAKVTVDQYGTYEFAWTTVNVTCQSTDVITVEFHDLPQVNAGRDTIICEDGYAQLQAMGTGTFAWTPAEELTDPAIANPIASPEVTTTFTVTLTDQYGCKNSDDVEVEVWNKPVIDAGPDMELEYLFNTDLEATPLQLHETGTWSLISGAGTFTKTNDPETRIKGLAQGENIVLWRVTNGVCQAVDDYITIKVNDLFIPSLITPNGDEYNQCFVLQGIETLGTTELVIFNRRGAQVYKNSNYDNSWDGKDYNGNELPDDTYFYV